jgi:hypothetical protein
MFENIMRAWVRDLRTTNTLQGREFLSMIRDGKFYDCCMGRLCKLAIASKIDIKVEKVQGTGYQLIRFEDDLSFLPDKVKAWANLRDVSGYISLPKCFDEGGVINTMLWNWHNVDPVNRPVGFSLDQGNDDGLTFPQIADLIEYFWEVL